MQHNITRNAETIAVDNVKKIAKLIWGENRAFTKPSKVGMKNILPITRKNNKVTIEVTPINNHSNLDLI